MDPSLRDLNDCGCCEGLGAQTPAVVVNRPGLSALAYRVGTHGQFYQSMLAALSGAERPALGRLTTRDPDDFSIALLDAWATVADVLTFYQERIANESYLRTATEHRSVLELARTIGYELRPGVAASTYLAFTLESAAGAPGYATLDVGTKVQSVPGPDEKPQTFETVEKLAARAAWNELKPRQTELVAPDTDAVEVYLKGTATNLRPGDGLLFTNVTSGQVPRWAFRRVKEVTADAAAGFTKVILEEKLVWRTLPAAIPPGLAGVRVYALRQRASLFGYNAPDWRATAKEVRLRYLGLSSTTTDNNTDVEWPGFSVAAISPSPLPQLASGQSGVGLFGEYYDDIDLTSLKLTRIDPQIEFDWAGGSPDPSLGGDTFSVRWRGRVKPRLTERYTFYVHSDNGARLWVNGLLVIDDWVEHPPHEVSGVIDLEANREYDLRLEYFENAGAASVKLSWSSTSQPTKEIVPQSHLFPPDTIYLDAAYPQILPDSWLVLSSPTALEIYRAGAVLEESRKGFTLSGKTTAVRLRGTGLLEKFNNQVRETVVFAQNEELPFVERPLTVPLEQQGIVLDRAVEGLEPGKKLIVRGTLKQPAPGSSAKPGDKASELAVLKQAVTQADGRTRLELVAPLQNVFDRPTVILLANVALATHGETVAEVLGSGDAGQPHQRFTLREAPLTYTPATMASGGESTLEVRLDDLKWTEVLTLFGRGPRERVYVTRRDDAGKTTVQFGDGHTGARPPTGQENVRATYRKGIGREGLVKAQQLSLLMTRPLGVKGVTNPLPATGAQDPQSLADARRNAPPTVLTLDRAVSLQDYEDFASSFSGIAKALVTWVWTGQARGVFVTVAGPGGDEVPEGTPLHDSLVTALQQVGDRNVPVHISSYRKAVFKLAADVTRDPIYLADRVQTDVRQALRSAFDFEARTFGQPVTLSEVIAVIHGVPGVAAVDVNLLHHGDQAATREVYLASEVPREGSAVASASAQPAELLLLDPASLDNVRVLS